MQIELVTADRLGCFSEDPGISLVGLRNAPVADSFGWREFSGDETANVGTKPGSSDKFA